MSGSQNSHEEPDLHYCVDGVCVSCFNDQLTQDFAEKIIELIKQGANEENRDLGDINIVIGNNDLLHRLNLRYLGLDYPTDVLAFEMTEDKIGCIEGDIYLSYQKAESQAVELNNGVEQEILRLAIHGFLHLCGWDHDDDVSLKEMIGYGEKIINMV